MHREDDFALAVAARNTNQRPLRQAELQNTVQVAWKWYDGTGLTVLREWAVMGLPSLCHSQVRSFSVC